MRRMSRVWHWTDRARPRTGLSGTVSILLRQPRRRSHSKWAPHRIRVGPRLPAWFQLLQAWDTRPRGIARALSWGFVAPRRGGNLHRRWRLCDRIAVVAAESRLAHGATDVPVTNDQSFNTAGGEKLMSVARPVQRRLISKGSTGQSSTLSVNFIAAEIRTHFTATTLSWTRLHRQSSGRRRLSRCHRADGSQHRG